MDGSFFVSGVGAADVCGYHTLSVWCEIKSDSVALIQGFESLAFDRSEVHENFGSRILNDETVTSFFVKPFDFAAGHNCSKFARSAQNEMSVVVQPRTPNNIPANYY
jgi:hypothetical protein